MPTKRVAAIVVVFGGLWTAHLFAQGTTATILGTVSDSSGATIAGASVRVTNVGTGQSQTVVTDTAGRYNVADLPVGNYEVQASREGFAKVIRKGISFSVGSQNVVDFSLAVGQAQQTVTVEGATTQVETTNSTVGALVDQTQMRELPLNGRSFEQLIQLAPGVQNYYAGTRGLNMREGKDAAISVAGGRPEGTALLMDDQNLETFYNRGLGSIIGTSLGVEAIGEFQTLTNTYGVQFGGNGAAMNAVTKSGTNGFSRARSMSFCATATSTPETLQTPRRFPSIVEINMAAVWVAPSKKTRYSSSSITRASAPDAGILAKRPGFRSPALRPRPTRLPPRRSTRCWRCFRSPHSTSIQGVEPGRPQLSKTIPLMRITCSRASITTSPRETPFSDATSSI